jgi:hypothetical protein
VLYSVVCVPHVPDLVLSCRPTHYHIITLSHHHIITSSHYHIITSSHYHIRTSAHLHICTLKRATRRSSTNALLLAFYGILSFVPGFSGTLEVLAGLVLLYRRTTTLGSMLAAGVFLNVAMLNLSYDIPVKIFSIQLFAMCLFLLVMEYRRLLDFFVLNKTAAPSVLYLYTPSKKWMRISKTVMKLAMICLGVGFTLYDTVDRYK